MHRHLTESEITVLRKELQGNPKALMALDELVAYRDSAASPWMAEIEARIRQGARRPTKRAW